MDILSKFPNSTAIMVAYNEEDRIEKQKTQDALLESEFKEHIIESIKMRSKYLDVMKDSALKEKKKPMITYITDWVEKARVISEREYNELSELKVNNPQMFAVRSKEIEIARNRRAAAYQKLQEKVKNIKTDIENSNSELKVHDLERMKRAGVVTDLFINRTDRLVTFTCKECFDKIVLTYDDVPAIYYGTQVDGVNVPLADFLRRIKLPMFKCPKCGKYHIFPYQVLNNLKDFAKVYLERHIKTYRKVKDSAPKSGMAYILADEIYAPCLAIKIDTSVDNVSNVLSKISSDKLRMAKDIGNTEKMVDSTEESDNIFINL